MSDDIYIINDGLEERTSKTGKTRYTVRISSEPVIFNLDAKAIGAQVTAAIVHHLREKVKGISAMASRATIKARQVEAKAYKAGKPWAVKRFDGGRTGATPPKENSVRAFNNSGRFANSIVGSASSDGAWRVNVAANRLDPTTSGGVQRIWKRLVELVPEFGSPAKLLENDVIRKSIEKATSDMMAKAREQRGKLQVQLAKSILGLVRQAASFGDLLSG